MTTPSPMTLRSMRVPVGRVDALADQVRQPAAIELDQVDRQQIVGLGQVQIALDDRVVMHDVAVVDQNLDAVGDLVLVAHRRARRAADRVEDVLVEDVEPAALQLAVDVARLLDDALHAAAARRPG